jgi:hypothetical protein
MQYVTDNGDSQVAEVGALVAADSKHVEHRLGGMCVAAVTGIDDTYIWRYAVGDVMAGA